MMSECTDKYRTKLRPKIPYRDIPLGFSTSVVSIVIELILWRHYHYSRLLSCFVRGLRLYALRANFVALVNECE